MNKVILLLVIAFFLQANRLEANIDKQATSAAKLLRAWQFTEAKASIRRLVTQYPSAPESLYLQAELSFFDGKYARVLSELEGLRDSDVDSNVGALRSLATTSLQATEAFLKVTSSKGHFEIYYPDGKDTAIVPLVDDVLETAYESIGNDLNHFPAEPIRVEILGAVTDLAKVSTLTEKEIETTGTIALCKYGKLMIVTPRATVYGYPWMDTLTHEYVHYVVTQMSQDRVPVWLHEGLARFLQTRWRGPATDEQSSLDEHLLAAALRKNKLVGFDEMHPSMAKLPSQEAAALAFVEVSSMVAYIHEKTGNNGLRQIIKLVKSGTSARNAVASVLNQSWRRIEKDWVAHLRSTRPQSKRFAERGRKIRFRKGEGNSDNLGVEAIRNSKARKLTRLAGMLRARGLQAAAAIEYEKALRIANTDDPLIGAKLSRVYLELGRYDEAATLAERLLDLDEMDPVPPTTLGAARLALGDAQQAGRALERALRITPFDEQVRCGLADAYRQLGDKRASREQDACELLRQAR